MNIVREDRDDRTSLVRVQVVSDDYNAEVERQLRDYRRKANIPGFRPGMVPMGLLSRMYRKGIVAEQSYKIASQGCFDYLEREKIGYVGDVMPAEEQEPFDFETQTEFEFVFEIGRAPAVEIALTKKDRIVDYRIRPDEGMHGSYRANFLRRFGQLVDVERVEGDEALSVTLDGPALHVEDAYVGLVSLDEERRKLFHGLAVGAELDVDVEELYPSPAQRAAVLGVKEGELEGMDPHFHLTVNRIRRFADPTLDEAFFRTAFPEGNVTDEEGLERWIDEQLAAQLDRESRMLFDASMRRLLQEKAALELPEEFLRRWLVAVNEGKFSREEVDRDFDGFRRMYTWNLIVKHYIRELGLEVSDEEALAEAKALAAAQFAQYGMPAAPDEMLTRYGRSLLENKQEAEKVYSRLFEKKIIEQLSAGITVEQQEVSPEEFGARAREVEA